MKGREGSERGRKAPRKDSLSPSAKYLSDLKPPPDVKSAPAQPPVLLGVTEWIGSRPDLQPPPMQSAYTVNTEDHGGGGEG